MEIIQRQTTNLMDNMRSKIIRCLIGFLFIVSNNMHAYDFQSDGIYYIIDGDNISCKYCKFNDICFKTNKDLVYLDKVDNLDFLGGDDDELDY